MVYKINKQLLQEELSPIARNGMALLGAGTGAALAHAGTFGTGAKNFVDGIGSAATGMAQTAGHIAGERLNQASNFYGNKADTKPTVDPSVNEVKHNVENHTNTDSNNINYPKPDAHHHSSGYKPEHHQQDDNDDDGSFSSGVLATLGAAGAGYLGLKGAKAANNSKAMGDFRSGFNGHSTPAQSSNMMRSAGLGLNSFGGRLRGAKQGFMTGGRR